MADQEVFDPYRKWLGIPASELPPTHYRLLGLVEFESDPDVISNAADRCMAHVRTYQTGAHGPISQKILNELSIARSCLLNPAARAQYDHQLRARRVAAPPAVTGAPIASPMAPVSLPGTPMPSQGAIPVATPVGSATGVMDGPDLGSVGKRTTVARRVKKKSSPIPMLATVALLMLAVVIVVLMMNNPSASKDSGKSSKSEGTQEQPRTIVIKRPRRDQDVTSGVLSPLGERDTNSGGAEVIDVRSSSEMQNRRLREEPTSAADAIELARLALGMSNPARARRLLETAKEFSPNAEQAATIEHLNKLQEYMANFYRALSSGVDELEPGRNFLIEIGEDQIPVTFKEFERQNGRRLVFEMQGRQMTYRLDELPASWVMPIARPQLDPESPAARLATATFLALASNGDRILAKQMWESLVAEGIADARLASELKLQLPTDVAVNTSSDPEMKTETTEDTAPQVTRPSNNLPVPTGEDLLEANRTFRDQYRDQLSKARTAEEKGALSQEIFAKSEEMSDNPALRYVMQAAAIDLAVGQGNPAEFVKLIDVHSKAYDVDPLKLKAAAFEEAESNAASVEQGEALYLAVAEVYTTAKELKHYEAAARLAKTAVKCAQRAQAREAADFAEVEASRMQSLYLISSAGMAGQETLKDSPDDPAALTAVGRMECFLNDNWESGLPMLAKGNDGMLADLAKMDLESPTETEAKVDLAAAWQKYAANQRDGGKRGPLLRAKYWYDSALESAEDSAQAEIEEKLQLVETQLKSEG